jgi:hypothetical protein
MVTRYDKLVIATRKQQAAMKTGAFQILNPMFKELVSVLEQFPKRINDRVKNFEWMIADTEIENNGEKRDGVPIDEREGKRAKVVASQRMTEITRRPTTGTSLLETDRPGR